MAGCDIGTRRFVSCFFLVVVVACLDVASSARGTGGTGAVGCAYSTGLLSRGNMKLLKFSCFVKEFTQCFFNEFYKNCFMAVMKVVTSKEDKK